MKHCSICGQTLTTAHVISIVEGFTVIGCPRFPTEEKPLLLKTKIYKGING